MLRNESICGRISNNNTYYGLHIGNGTMYNMTDTFPTFEAALDRAKTLLERNYRLDKGRGKEYKVLMDNGLFEKPTEIFSL